MPGSLTLPAGIPSPTDRSVARVVAEWVAVDRDRPAAAVAAVVGAVAAARGLEIDLVVDATAVPPSPRVAAELVDDTACELVAGGWGPWLPGLARESLVSDDRRRLGVHHTPASAVDEILDLVDTHGCPLGQVSRVLDPSVGGGAFLLGVASRSLSPPDRTVDAMWAVDVDPLAIATTIAALSLWAGVPPRPEQMVVGNFLSDEVRDVLAPSFDLVIGNPPFRSPLRSDTARADTDRARLRRRWPDLGRHVDDAAAFLLAAADHCGEAGVVALVQPDSVLGAEDAGPVRERLDRHAPLRGLWVDRHRSFAAGVDAVAVVAGGPDPPGSVAVQVGSGPVTVRSCPEPSSWAPLLAGARGVPVLGHLAVEATLGDIADVTAGFRDQYYGLVDAVHEDPDAALRLVTVGLIDPLRSAWGERPCRFSKRTFRHPAVDLDRVDDAIAVWVRRRLRPKVLVASQTRVLEAVVDLDGTLVPSVPVVSVEPVGSAPSLWHVAALLTSPVSTVISLLAGAGTAMSADAIRVSASSLASLPLPLDRDGWDEAAAAASNGDVAGCGAAMLAAHGIADRSDLLDFWWGRLPN